MTNVFVLRPLVTAIFLVTSSAIALRYDTPCSFEGLGAKAAVCVSPNGRYAIEEHGSSGTAGDPRHVLVLKDNATGVSRQLYTYNRSLSLIWAPDSRRLVINDYAGSDYTKNVVFVPDGSTGL